MIEKCRNIAASADVPIPEEEDRLRDYVLMTDATCDLPADVLEKLDVRVIPMEFQIGGTLYHHYPDARELPVQTFYERMQAGETASTSQINGVTYTHYFEPVLQAGQDVLYLAFSSALSGTYQSSLIAAADLQEKYPESRIVCLDSRCASIGQGLFVLLAAREKERGAAMDEVVRWGNGSHYHIGQWFTVDDLKYLRRGGRISSVAAVTGSALGIKPILHVDSEGALVPAMRMRGRKKSMEALVEKMAETCINPGEQTVLIGHGNSEKDAKKLRHDVKERFHPKEIILCDIGPVIGCHVGPGMLAVSFWASEN
jgi:DegV family protein with EDD domain